MDLDPLREFVIPQVSFLKHVNNSYVTVFKHSFPRSILRKLSISRGADTIPLKIFRKNVDTALLNAVPILI